MDTLINVYVKFKIALYTHYIFYTFPFEMISIQIIYEFPFFLAVSKQTVRGYIVSGKTVFLC